LSSPQALRLSLEERLRKINDKLKNLNTDEEASITENEARAEVLDNDTGERVNDEEVGKRLDRYVFGYVESLKKEKELIDAARDEAKKITPSRAVSPKEEGSHAW
jgi:predicted metal-dependent hydrolase